MSTKKKILIATCVAGGVGLSGLIAVKGSFHLGQKRSSVDDAFLALIKNDRPAFEAFVEGGGNLQGHLPLVDSKQYSVSEGMAHFKRTSFMKYLHDKKISFIQQSKGLEQDIVSLSIPVNDPEMLSILVAQKADLGMSYGEKKWNLLHLASNHCSHKLVSILHEKGNLKWDARDKDGATPLTLAAENECLPILSYWKEQKADFHHKDGRGMSALSILRKKKDAALIAFVESFELRKIAQLSPSAHAEEVNFYRKRKIPRDQIIDHKNLIEPEDRPLEANETAEFTEFSD